MTVEPDHTPHPEVPDHLVAQRAAELTPEEREAGSADPEAQARAILEDSEERLIEAGEHPRSSGERRTSDETTDPLDQ